MSGKMIESDALLHFATHLQQGKKGKTNYNTQSRADSNIPVHLNTHYDNKTRRESSVIETHIIYRLIYFQF